MKERKEQEAKKFLEQASKDKANTNIEDIKEKSQVFASQFASSMRGFFSKAAEKAKEVKNSEVMSSTFTNVKDGVTTAANSEFVQGIKETVVEIAADVRDTKHMVTEMRAEYD